jgi:hypothetical protein
VGKEDFFAMQKGQNIYHSVDLTFFMFEQMRTICIGGENFVL